MLRMSPSTLTPLTVTLVSIPPPSVKYALKRGEFEREFKREFNEDLSRTLRCVPEISNSKIVRTQTERICSSTNQSCSQPLIATHKHYQENFLRSDSTVSVNDPATMEWHSLNSEWDLLDLSQQLAPPTNDWSTDLLIDETLHNSDQSFDISDLDEYLYPQSSYAQPYTYPTPRSVGEAADNQHVDPLSEFFPELIMPPCDQYVPAPSTTLDHSYEGVDGTVIEHLFLETPCKLETYCGDAKGSPNSSISETYSFTTPNRNSHSARSGGRVHFHNSSPTHEGVTDYRIRRDKNNLSSQRSREKRRSKVLQLKEECSKLELRNIELKASVDLLEKSVAEYKQIMLSFIKQ